MSYALTVKLCTCVKIIKSNNTYYFFLLCIFGTFFPQNSDSRVIVTYGNLLQFNTDSMLLPSLYLMRVTISISDREPFVLNAKNFILLQDITDIDNLLI